MASLFERARTTWRKIRHHSRRRWRQGKRLHLEVRPVPAELSRSFASATEAAFATFPEVHWARYNAVLGRVVVELAREPDDAILAELDAALDAVEERFGLAEIPFADDEAAQHPGDDEIRVRTRVEIGADVLGIATGLAFRLYGVRADGRRLPLDLAALLSALEGIPDARLAIEGRLGKGTTELALNLGKAISSAMLQGAVGPSVDAARRVLRLREVEARAAAFATREEELCGDADGHPPMRPDVGSRPQPLPRGPIERYSEKAVLATLGGAGFGLASSQSLEGAAAGIFGGLPRPAYLGREAFAAWLGLLLGRRDVVVLEREALRRLDRVDFVVLEGALDVGGDSVDPDLEALVLAAKRAGLRVRVGGEARLRAKRVAAGLAGVRELQREGHAVLYVGSDAEALLASDVGVGVMPSAGPAPFCADLICADGLRDARILVDATRAARDASSQAVQMAGVELATSVLLALGGLEARTVRRVMLAAHATQILAMGNGIRLADQVYKPGAAGYRAPHVAWHTMSPADVLSALSTDPAGLAEVTVAARRPRHLAPKSRARRLGGLVVEELANPLTPILVAGAGLSALMGGLVDASMVGGVLGVNTALGVGQRFRTERDLRELFAEEQRTVRVRRGGVLTQVATDELVPGDVVELDAGEVVPADGRLLGAKGLEVDEASLTGESVPVRKRVPAVALGAPVAERHCMLYAGTVVAAGEAVFVVTAVGEETEAERGLADVEVGEAGGVEARLDALTSLTAPLAAGAGAAVILAGLARQRVAPPEIVSAGVSLAVAAVPEGLPLIATSAQLAAAKRLSERGAIVRNPRAIEALGRVTVLCADKTGTLTAGKLSVRFVHDGEREAAPESLDEGLRSVLRVALRATPPREADGPLPHPTDQALVDAGTRAGVDVHETLRIRGELPFEPARGYHALWEDGGRLHVKGAPEVIAARCTRWIHDDVEEPLDAVARERLHAAAASLAGRGLRVLAIADGQLADGKLADDAVRGLRFRGLVGIADPVRPTAKSAIDELRRAGVTTLMITGDHPTTAAAIARDLALDGELPTVITGPELDGLSDVELVARIERVRVFARVTPSQKVRIVRALKASGEVVAMTGDGANDAQAIRLADVGIALGHASTGAARHAADLVVADGRVESIVAAVLEGRALWRSVREAVALLVGGNLGEIGFTLAGGLIGGRSPLNARQLLLVNLLTDALPALAVALRPPSSVTPEELLEEGPEASLGDALERDIVERGVITGTAATLAWLLARATGDRRGADTVGLLALVGAQLGQTLVSGGRSPFVLATGLGSLAALLAIVETPATSLFFGSRPLGPVGLAQAAGAASVATAAAWAWPKLRRRFAAASEAEAPTPGVSPVERWRRVLERMRDAAPPVARGGEHQAS
ncbi:MAG: HAD-IC family P-type ATPase [Myxococcales bacterium]|nr:HAD-IC family P-type ATPase [Myxococcales bacterium]